MALDFIKDAKNNEDPDDPYTAEEWLDLYKFQEIFNHIDGMMHTESIDAVEKLAMSHGQPSQKVISSVCRLISFTTARMTTRRDPSIPGIEDEDPDDPLVIGDELTEKGMWRVMQMVTITIFKYAFECGRTQGVEATEDAPN